MKKRIFSALIVLVLTLSACGRSSQDNASNTEQSTTTNTTTGNATNNSANNTTGNTGNASAQTITTAGTHVLTGNITDKTVTIAVPNNETVELVLDNVTIKNTAGPALYIQSAGEVVLTLKDGTANTISDGSSYDKFEGYMDVDAAIYSNANLTIHGDGSLTVLGNYEHGISSNGNLTVTNGNINITAKKSAIEAENDLTISDGDITVTKSENGLEADHIYLAGGYTVINATEEGIDSDGILDISGGITLISTPATADSSALDYDTRANITGGVIVALGSTHMSHSTFSSEKQAVMTSTFATQKAGSSFLINDKDNRVIVSFTPGNEYDCAIVSSPHMTAGAAYHVVVDAVVEHADKNGFAENSIYTGGTKIDIVDLSTQRTTK